jgi:outer membrane protein
MQFRTLFLATAAFVAASSSFAMADDMGDSPWQIRLRAIAVLPDASADVKPLGGSVHISKSVVPEADVSYFFDSHWSLELIAATIKHSVTHIPTDLHVASAWLLPPTLTAQYHFDQIGPFRPYIGAGINYTFFYNVDGNPALAPVKLSDNFGEALQVGVDMPIGDDGYFLNVDAKKLFLNTRANIAGGAVTAHVDINPWILGTGVGYRF